MKKISGKQTKEKETLCKEEQQQQNITDFSSGTAAVRQGKNNSKLHIL